MAQFTQLGLSGEPERKPKQEAARKASGALRPEEHAKFSRKTKTAATVCSLMAMSLLGVSLLETGGCSKSNDKVSKITAPSEMASMPAPMAESPLPAPSTTPAVAKKAVAKKSRQRTLVASTYSNPVYGVSFRYLKPYSLKEGDKANSEWDALKPAQMNFVQPGGTAVSTVELPNRLYAGTDFSAAFFNLSVNTNLSAAQCGEFAAPEASHAGASPAPDAAKPASSDTDKPVEASAAAPAAVASSATESVGITPAATTPATIEPAKVKVGSAEFTEVENAGSDAAKKSDAKYYHVYQNGTCYEFALGVETKGDAATGGMKSVDRSEVFRKLNWMLSTVKIQPAGVPATQTAGSSVGGGKE